MSVSGNTAKVVMLYGFRGRFAGSTSLKWNHPEIGATHNCMLFLTQDAESDDADGALQECARFGFDDITNLVVGRFQVEVLNSDQFKGFAGFYEEALSTGSALVFYPEDSASSISIS